MPLISDYIEFFLKKWKFLCPKRHKDKNQKSVLKDLSSVHTKMTWTAAVAAESLKHTLRSNGQEPERHFWFPPLSQVCIQTCIGFSYIPHHAHWMYNNFFATLDCSRCPGHLRWAIRGWNWRSFLAFIAYWFLYFQMY